MEGEELGGAEGGALGVEAALDEEVERGVEDEAASAGDELRAKGGGGIGPGEVTGNAAQLGREGGEGGVAVGEAGGLVGLGGGGRAGLDVGVAVGEDNGDVAKEGEVFAQAGGEVGGGRCEVELGNEEAEVGKGDHQLHERGDGVFGVRARQACSG